MPIAELMVELVIQIGLVLFAVRIGGRLAKWVGLPSVLGELLSGVLIGPYALGGIALPGFANGIFPLNEGALAVSPVLYAFATVASLVLLFVSGLETNLGLFLRYSVTGGVIGLCEAVLSFAAGALCGAVLMQTSFMDPRCLFLGVIAASSSTGITARILSDKKKMDSPEGVTILATIVFEDVPWIILLAITLGIASAVNNPLIENPSVLGILGIAGKTFGIWLAAVAVGVIASKQIASFLKIFRRGFDFSILALGLALILAGLMEKQGLAMIVGAYIIGLSLSRTDIVAVIQDRIRGLYEFFVPIFFAVMGMMVNVRELMSTEVLIFGGIYTAAVILAKIVGCGGPAMALGFNAKGALRIGAGLVPHGEGALIAAGIGLAAGVLNNQHFSIAVLMVLLTVIVAPSLFNMALKIRGRGTRKPVKTDDNVQEVWEFETGEIAELVMGGFLYELRLAEFFVQKVNVSVTEGISQARKGDIAIFISEKGSTVTIKTSRADMPFVKNEMYEVILDLSETLHRLKTSAFMAKMKKELFDSSARAPKDVLALINARAFILSLKGTTKRDVIAELVDVLAAEGKLLNRDHVLEDVLEREESMSTGMVRGIALPHGKTEGVADTVVAVGIKKSGVDFSSMDGAPSRLFIMIVSPKDVSGLHVQFLAAVGCILRDETLLEAVINASTPQEAVALLQQQENEQ